MKVISVRKHPEYKDFAIHYFQKSWPGVWSKIFEDSIAHSLTAKDHLPQWYLLEHEGEVIGCAGLITNDFISRGDLYPWLNALFMDEKYRGKGHSSILIEHAKNDCKKMGYQNLYLCTQHNGYYEKHGFSYIGQGYHPWGGESRIYEIGV